MPEIPAAKVIEPKNSGKTFVDYVDFMNEAIDIAYRTFSLRAVIDGIASGKERAILAAIDDWLTKKKEYEEQSGVEYLTYSAIQLPQLNIGVALLEALGLPIAPDMERAKQLNGLRRKKSTPDKKVKPHKPGFVYLMVNKRNKYVKIGWSKNPTHREETLQAEDPDVEMLYKFPAIFSTEKQLHEKYAEFRVRGEWFQLNEVHIHQIVCLFEEKNG